MAIIFVNRYFHPDQSATSRMVSSLAFALAGKGYDIRVVTGRYYHDRRSAPLPSRELIDGVDVIRVRTTAFGRAGTAGRAVDYGTFHLSVAAWLAGHARGSDICVFCTDPPLISVSGAAAAGLAGARTANWVMDLFPEVATELGVMDARSVAARTVLALRDWSYRRAALTICPIESMRSYLQCRGHVGQTAIARHWADDADLRPVDRRANRLVREWGLSDTFVVGYSGNFGRAHEFSTIVAAAKRLEADPGIRFLLIGAGHNRAAVEEEVMRLGLTNVIFRPFQPKHALAESLSVADVHLVSLLPNLEHCVIPSKFYGILAVGRPTIFIGSAQGEIARNLAESGCGIRIEPGDGAALANALLGLRDHPQMAAAMGARARALLERTYTRSHGVANWMAAIAPLIAAPRPERAGEKSREATP